MRHNLHPITPCNWITIQAIIRNPINAVTMQNATEQMSQIHIVETQKLYTDNVLGGAYPRPSRPAHTPHLSRPLASLFIVYLIGFPLNI